jgi:hypothetical protein
VRESAKERERERDLSRLRERQRETERESERPEVAGRGRAGTRHTASKMGPCERGEEKGEERREKETQRQRKEKKGERVEGRKRETEHSITTYFGPWLRHTALLIVCPPANIEKGRERDI